MCHRPMAAAMVNGMKRTHIMMPCRPSHWPPIRSSPPATERKTMFLIALLTKTATFFGKANFGNAKTIR